jgi:hypothetical protein
MGVATLGVPEKEKFPLIHEREFSSNKVKFLREELQFF